MPWSEPELAQRVAADVVDGWVVNVGIGLPTLVVPLLYGRDVLLHSENGIIGMGPAPGPGAEDIDVVDAGKQYASVVPGGAIIDSVGSFTLIRGGRLALAVVGAYQVSFAGDLANWRLPGRKVAGIGGAADLAAGARQLWAMMKFGGPKGEPRFLERCTLPLTARGVVRRVYCDLGVFECGAPPRVLDAAPGVDLAWLDAYVRGTLAGESATGEATR